jgi:hypothetical protein
VIDDFTVEDEESVVSTGEFPRFDRKVLGVVFFEVESQGSGDGPDVQEG